MRNYAEMAKVAKLAMNKIIEEMQHPDNVLITDKPKMKISRYKSDIKALEIATDYDLKEYFDYSDIEVKIDDLDREEELLISGKYKAKLVTLKKSKSGLGSAGDSFYVVNTKTEKGSIKTKDLAPDKLGLTRKKYRDKAQFDKDVQASIKKMYEAKKINQPTAAFLNRVYKLVSKSSKNQTEISFEPETKILFQALKPQDIQAIGKDFGEILSLRWYTNQEGTDLKSFYFSEMSNEPLVDFSVETSDGLKKVSAKFEKGAAPSIGAIVSSIDRVYSRPKENLKPAIETLKILGGVEKSVVGKNISYKILKVYENLNERPYKTLQRILGKRNVELEDINAFIQKIASKHKTPKDRIQEFKKVFDQFYDVIGKNVTEDSLKVVFSEKTYKKYYSLLLSPMGYSLINFMNKDASYQEVLNKTAKTINVDQVHLYFKGDSAKFETFKFKESKFRFDYGANAKDSDNTGIKFYKT